MPLDTTKTYKDITTLYDLMCSDRECEAQFYGTYIANGRDFLEIGCGTGLLSERLDRLGYNVVGIDNSDEMLSVCKSRCPDVRVENADMRDFDLDQTFDLVAIPYNTLSHMMNKEDVIATFECVRRHCKPDARFIFALHHHAPAHHELNFAADAVKSFYDKVSGQVSRAIRSYEIFPEEERLTITWHVVCPEILSERRRHELVTRLHRHDDLQEYLRATGFEIEDCFENEHKAAFTDKSLMQILVAKPVA